MENGHTEQEDVNENGHEEVMDSVEVSDDVYDDPDDTDVSEALYEATEHTSTEDPQPDDDDEPPE